MNKAISWALRFILGISILALLLYKIGFESILGVFIQMNLVYLPIIVILYFMNLYFGSLNIVILMKPIKTTMTLLDIYKYYMLSWGVGLFIPGRVGEVSLVYFLKKHDLPLGQGFLIFFLDKFVSVLVLGIVSIVGFFIFFDVGTALWLLGLVLVIISFSGGVIFSTFGRDKIKKYILRKYAKKFKGFSQLLKFYMTKKFHLLLLNFLNTTVRWIVSAIIYYFAFLSFGVNLPLWLIFLITCITSVMSFIPITISGLGIRESVGVYLYSLQGIEAPIVASAYLLVVICSYSVAAFIFYFCNYKELIKE